MAKSLCCKPLAILIIEESYLQRFFHTLDFLLENGRHRSSKMWYCRLYNIMMLQHLDAWDLPYKSTLRKLILEAA